MHVCLCPLLCLSLWYKIHKSHERGPDRKAGGGSEGRQGTGKGEGCGGWAARWLAVPRAGTACWHRAGARPQAAFSARGKRVKGFKDKSNQCKLELGLFFRSSLIAHWLSAPLSLYTTLWFSDVCFIFNLGRPPSCLQPWGVKSGTESAT